MPTLSDQITSAIQQAIAPILATSAQQLSDAQGAAVAATAQLAQANVTIATLKQQLAQPAPAPLPAATPAGVTEVPDGTEVSTWFSSKPAGIYDAVPGGHYTCNGSPTMRADQVWRGDAANRPTITFTLAPGASACIAIEAFHAEISGFRFVGGGFVRIRPGGDGAPRIAGTPTAPGFPNYYPQGNVIRDCEFDGTMFGVIIHGNAVGTVVINNLFHKVSNDCVYNCGLHSLVAFNQFPEGSQAEHQFRNEIDGTLEAEDVVVCFNWFDNRTNADHKEDATFRMGHGVTFVGNVCMGWGSAAQNPSGDNQPHGSPLYLRSNIFPNIHRNFIKQPDGSTQQQDGAVIQADPYTTVYCDGNYFPSSDAAASVTVYSIGNLLTRANVVVNPLPNAKPTFGVLGVGSVPFKGKFEAIDA